MEYKLFRLHLTTNVKDSWHQYEIQWGYFERPEPEFVVLGVGRTEKLDDKSMVQWGDIIRGCEALVKSCGGFVLDERKQTSVEKARQAAEAKKNALRMEQEKAEFEEAHAKIPGLRK